MNYPPEDRDCLLAAGVLGLCKSTGKEFSVSHVEVIDRYSDCTGFRCPACGSRHDDRRAWSGLADERMGYWIVRRPSPDSWEWLGMKR